MHSMLILAPEDRYASETSLVSSLKSFLFFHFFSVYGRKEKPDRNYMDEGKSSTLRKKTNRKNERCVCIRYITVYHWVIDRKKYGNGQMFPDFLSTTADCSYRLRGTLYSIFIPSKLSYGLFRRLNLQWKKCGQKTRSIEKCFNYFVNFLLRTTKANSNNAIFFAMTKTCWKFLNCSFIKEA